MTAAREGTKTVLKRDRKMVLSTRWIFALINYIYADIFTAFFNPLKMELIGQRIFQTREQARRETFEYIEVFYHRRWAALVPGIPHTGRV